MKVKVAAIQMSADIGGREANVERAERLLIQAARQGADLCVLPELALDEFFPLYKDTRYFAYAEELDGPTVRRFRSLAGELGIYLALPLFEKNLIGTYYNSLVLLTPEGTIGAVYRKVHVPCTRSYERYYFTPGPEFVVADTRYGKVGLAICYDRRYPETCRELMKKGARAEDILVTGIPVRQQFLDADCCQKRERNRTRRVLIMGGGLGLMPDLKELLEKLHSMQGVESVVITGKNHKMYEEWVNRYEDVEVLGYTENISRYMRLQKQAELRCLKFCTVRFRYLSSTRFWSRR